MHLDHKILIRWDERQSVQNWYGARELRKRIGKHCNVNKIEAGFSPTPLVLVAIL